MTGFIPPLSIAVSGNKCGGCCRNTSVRGTAPSHYIIILNKESRLVAVPESSIKQAADVAIRVFSKIEEYLKGTYGVSVEEIAPLDPSLDLSRAPSVRDLRSLEMLAKGYGAGIRRARSTSSSEGSPTLPQRARTPLPERQPHSDSSGDSVLQIIT